MFRDLCLLYGRKICVLCIRGFLVDLGRRRVCVPPPAIAVCLDGDGNGETVRGSDGGTEGGRDGARERPYEVQVNNLALGL